MTWFHHIVCTHVPMQMAVLQCGGRVLWPRSCPKLGGGGGGCVHTLWYSWCVCDPQVVLWTQQTTTVGVLCSCCPTPLTVRGQGEQGEGDGGRRGRRRRGRRMVNGYLLYITM